jgi:hypothetical protein
MFDDTGGYIELYVRPSDLVQYTLTILDYIIIYWWKIILQWSKTRILYHFIPYLPFYIWF